MKIASCNHIVLNQSQTLNKKRLPNKFEKLGLNRTFLNGKLPLSLLHFFLFVHWLRSHSLVSGFESIVVLEIRDT